MYDTLLARLKPFGQEHVLAFWSQLDPAAQQKLARQIDGVDLALVRKLSDRSAAHEAWQELAERALPPTAITLADQADTQRAAAARRAGLAAFRAGEVGAIIVAGGQGTRLGFDHPKGMYSIGPVSGATLFRILCEKVLACGRTAGVRMPLYVMTSPATHDETVRYLAEQRYFGLPEADVTIFCQGTMPAVDAETGKLLLAERGALFLGPDGHGGLLAALARSGALADMQRRGLRNLIYAQIDNPLAGLTDPEFLGYHLAAESELSTQVVAKRTLREKVGNVVEIDGRLRIIEYSDLNPLADEIVERKLPDGRPVFWAGNIATHVLAVDFLARVASSADGLPFHCAHKAVRYVDPATGEAVTPKEPNAIKFERFIFDLLPEARRAIVVEVNEQRAFAPVKNAPGETTHTPQIVQGQMIALAREWLLAAGAQVAAGVPVEISPLVAEDATQLAGRIEPNLIVTQPRYFC